MPEMQNGVDAVVQALADLKAACRLAKAANRARQVPHGAYKAVTVTLLNSVQSWSCVHAALQCLLAVAQCAPDCAAALRHEGGLKACHAALKKHSKRTAALQLISRLFAKALTSHSLTGAAMLQVRIPAQRDCHAVVQANCSWLSCVNILSVVISRAATVLHAAISSC